MQCSTNDDLCIVITILHCVSDCLHLFAISLLIITSYWYHQACLINVCANDDHGPDDYVWIVAEEVANPGILESFQKKEAVAVPPVEVAKPPAQTVSSKETPKSPAQPPGERRVSNRPTKGKRSDSKYISSVLDLGEVIAEGRYSRSKSFAEFWVIVNEIKHTIH